MCDIRFMFLLVSQDRFQWGFLMRRVIAMMMVGFWGCGVNPRGLGYTDTCNESHFIESKEACKLLLRSASGEEIGKLYAVAG